MNDLDMSPSGSELFPVEEAKPYNSYTDVQDQVVAGQSGVETDAAGLSEKEMNFRALREEVSKIQSDKSRIEADKAKVEADLQYWRGQAEAYSKVKQPEPPNQDAYAALDWDDGRDVKRGFEALRLENQRLREEMRDAITAVETKTQRQDWNAMVTQHVPQLTSKNPIFAEMIKNASNPYEAAYLLAELNARANQPMNVPEPAKPGYGQRAVANASKPQTLASVGGQGQLSAADHYASMSDEDFFKLASKNLGGI